MACDCDCQMLKTIKYLIRKNKELEERLVDLEIRRDLEADIKFINRMADRKVYEQECECGCDGNH